MACSRRPGPRRDAPPRRRSAGPTRRCARPAQRGDARRRRSPRGRRAARDRRPGPPRCRRSRRRSSRRCSPRAPSRPRSWRGRRDRRGRRRSPAAPARAARRVRARQREASLRVDHLVGQRLRGRGEQVRRGPEREQLQARAGERGDRGVLGQGLAGPRCGQRRAQVVRHRARGALVAPVVAASHGGGALLVADRERPAAAAKMRAHVSRARNSSALMSAWSAPLRHGALKWSRTRPSGGLDGVVGEARLTGVRPARPRPSPARAPRRRRPR